MEPRFSGHETFPLRYGWLYKSCNFIKNKEKVSLSNNADLEDAVIELGVGKNMVAAMRYWSEACSVIKITKGTSNQHLSALGKYLFVGDMKQSAEGMRSDLSLGRDPFLEKKGSIWLLHFLLNFNESELTAYRYFFNLASFQKFDKEKLIQDIESDVQYLCTKEVKASSIKKDIDCFLQTYCTKRASSSKGITEDHFSSPLSELKLISDAGKSSYIALLEDRPDLPLEVFLYAVLRFVHETKNSVSASFDALLSDQNSPGKIFRLSERGLGNHLERCVKEHPYILAIEDSQGLRQVKVLKDYPRSHSFFEVLDGYYGVKQ